MCFKVFKNTVLFPIIIGLALVAISCGNQVKQEAINTTTESSKTKDTSTALSVTKEDNKSIVVGANRTEQYLTLLQGKRVGIVANQTSVIFLKEMEFSIDVRADYIDEKSEIKSKVTPHKHIVDSLLDLNLNIKKVFSPEHGLEVPQMLVSW